MTLNFKPPLPDNPNNSHPENSEPPIDSWYTQKAMARILGTSQQNISKHLQKIFKDNPGLQTIFCQYLSRKETSFRPNPNFQIGKTYYHQFILEMVAIRLKCNQNNDIFTTNARYKDYLPFPRINMLGNWISE